MAQYWTVKKAFQGKDRETGAVEVIQTKGGDAHKFLVQVENQPVEGWFSVLKKPGNVVKEGDQLYGTIEENNYGKPQFTRMQEPQDGSRPKQTNTGERSVSEKLDYIISMLENQFRAKKESKDAGVPEDIDDGPVDLDSIDY